MKLQLEVVFSHVSPKQPSNGDVTIRGWVENRTGGEIADGKVREKGMTQRKEWKERTLEWQGINEWSSRGRSG